jgi:hypothetical protein
VFAKGESKDNSGKSVDVPPEGEGSSLIGGPGYDEGCAWYWEVDGCDTLGFEAGRPDTVDSASGSRTR